MDARGRPCVVELVGLAGSGKTTLARELAQGGAGFQLGLPVSRPRSAAAQARALLPCLMPYLRHTPGARWFDRDQARGLGYLHAWRTLLEVDGVAVGCLLLDHGPLFRLAQVDGFGPPVTATSTFRRWRDEQLRSWTRLLDLVVWLDAPEDVLIRRIRSRDQKHVLRDADPAIAKPFLATYREAYGHLLTRVELASPGTVVYLRTDELAPTELAAQVRERLACLDPSDV